jgi:hypothetical protein
MSRPPGRSGLNCPRPYPGSRAWLGLLLASALVGAAPAPQLRVQLERTTLDLLDSLPIAVVIDNPSTRPIALHFAQPAEYRIDVLSGGKVLWSSLPAAPAVHYVARARSFAAGPTTIAVYDWNELVAGAWSPLPGRYRLRVKLLAEGGPPAAEIPVRFARPLSPSSLPMLQLGQAYTLAGTLSAGGSTLRDARGSAALSRKILGAPPGAQLVVRGYVTVTRTGRVFTVERWAPLGPPETAASPLPSVRPSPAFSPPWEYRHHGTSP